MPRPRLQRSNPGRTTISVTGRLLSSRLLVAGLVALTAPGLVMARAVLADRDSGPGWISLPDTVGRFLPVFSWAAAAVLLLATPLIVLGWRSGRVLAIAGMAGAALLLGMRADLEPGIAMLAGTWLANLTYLVVNQSHLGRRVGIREGDDPVAVLAPAVLAIVTSALAVTLVGYAEGVVGSGRVALATTALLVVAGLLASAAEIHLARKKALSPLWALPLLLLTVLPPLLIREDGLVHACLGARLLLAAVGSARAHALWDDIIHTLWSRPAVAVALTFVVLIGSGALLLALPGCSSTGRAIPLLDAVFTSASACCVTGLAVLETGTDFSLLGQVVILFLIQVGAVGFMSLSALATLIVGGSIGARAEGAMGELFGGSSPKGTRRIVRAIFIGTISIEAIGALCLFPRLLAHGQEPLSAAGHAVFQAVSSFCNAGFMLRGDSLVAFQDDPVVLHVMGTLITLGGLGFGVLVGLFELARRKNKAAPSLHLRIVLITHFSLLFLGFFGWTVLEWNRSLAGMGIMQKVSNALFQAVTMRTAGFNSVAMDDLSPATVLCITVCMFIGASPGSTGGGIKTTTFAILFLAIVATMRGQKDAEAYGRTIPQRAVYRAAAVATISALVVFMGALLLMVTQDLQFRTVLFEAVSAFGTVGLSLGVTPALDGPGKLITILLMFLGRIGPLTLALLLGRVEPRRWRYPEEEVMVG